MKKEPWEKIRVIGGDVIRCGATKTTKGINFTFQVKEKRPDTLLLYLKGDKEPKWEVDLSKAAVMGNLLAIEVQGISKEEYEYHYACERQILLDPCAKKITGNRCGFGAEDYDWRGDKKPNIPYQDACMYSLHVRGFTMNKGAKVRHSGTFLGLLEKAKYIKNLGFNQVKLMPVYEFFEQLEDGQKVDKRYVDIMAAAPKKKNFWGYGAGYYYALKNSYAATTDVTREFKDMVKALHKNGIEVILEMFFTTDIDYRTAVDCLLYWSREYRVDGFWLGGNQNLANALAREPLFTRTKILGEYFPKEEIYKKKTLPKVKNLGEYNDGYKMDIRRFLKGEAHQLETFAYRTRRNPEYCGVINYIADNNGFTLMDMVSYDEKHNEENEEQNHDGTSYNESWNCGVEGPTRKKKILDLRYRQMKNALTILFLSAGTPMLMAGDECGNTQAGNNNAYCQDNEVGWVDWIQTRRNKEILEFVKGMLAFRKKHQILRMAEELQIRDTLSCGYPDLSYHGDRAWYGESQNGKRHLGILYCGKYAKEECFIYAAYNSHWTEQEFALPQLPEKMKWYIAIDTEIGIYEDGKELLLEEIKQFKVKGRTTIVLIAIL